MIDPMIERWGYR